MLPMEPQRRCEPPATDPLVRFQPGDISLQSLVLGRHPRLPGYVDGKAGGVAVARQWHPVQVIAADEDCEFGAVALLRAPSCPGRSGASGPWGSRPGWP